MRRASTLLAAAAGGALPAALGGGPVALLAWLALTASAIGFLCGARDVPLPAALVPPAAWAVLLVALGRGGEAPEAHFGALGAAGLFGVGLGLGARAERAAPGAAALLLLSAALVALPLMGALGGEPLAARSPRLAVALLELSPATWLVESAGADWMRVPGVYDSAGIDWFPPERRAFRGALAGPLLFVVGCAAAVLLPRLPQRRPRRGEPEGTRSG